jgi:hypothetical protein
MRKITAIDLMMVLVSPGLEIVVCTHPELPRLSVVEREWHAAAAQEIAGGAL